MSISISIMYLNANNLYGAVMVEALPLSGFEWLGKEEIDALDITTDDRRLHPQG